MTHRQMPPGPPTFPDGDAIDTERRVYGEPVVQLLIDVRVYTCGCWRASPASKRTTHDGSWPRRRRSRSLGPAPRAHALIRSSNVASIACLSSAERAGARTDRFSSNRTMRDGPAERLGERHPSPVVVPLGRSERDVGRCRLHRLAIRGHRADLLEESRPSFAKASEG
jgi:hypothetical protein